LASYKIRNHSTIHLMLRLCGSWGWRYLSCMVIQQPGFFFFAGVSLGTFFPTSGVLSYNNQNYHYINSRAL
jgi:hypothetical protein